MAELCADNRFDLIEKYKKKLIEATNIETSTEEMNVLDSILFRFWQMGWLEKLEQPEIRCKDCKYKELQQDWKYRSYAHISIWKCGKGHGKDLTDSIQENDYCAWPERKEY